MPDLSCEHNYRCNPPLINEHTKEKSAQSNSRYKYLSDNNLSATTAKVHNEDSFCRTDSGFINGIPWTITAWKELPQRKRTKFNCIASEIRYRFNSEFNEKRGHILGVSEGAAYLAGILGSLDSCIQRPVPTNNVLGQHRIFFHCQSYAAINRSCFPYTA